MNSPPAVLTYCMCGGLRLTLTELPGETFGLVCQYCEFKGHAGADHHEALHGWNRAVMEARIRATAEASIKEAGETL